MNTIALVIPNDIICSYVTYLPSYNITLSLNPIWYSCLPPISTLTMLLSFIQRLCYYIYIHACRRWKSRVKILKIHRQLEWLHQSWTVDHRNVLISVNNMNIHQLSTLNNTADLQNEIYYLLKCLIYGQGTIGSRAITNQSESYMHMLNW